LARRVREVVLQRFPRLGRRARRRPSDGRHQRVARAPRARRPPAPPGSSSELGNRGPSQDPDINAQPTAWRPAPPSPVRALPPAPTWAASWEQAPPLARALGLGGLILAFGLLIRFFIVVP